MIAQTIRLYKDAYSGLSRRIWLLAVVMLINRSGTMVLAFMTLYCKHLGYTTQQGGLVVAIYGVGAIVGAFFGGKLTDSIGFYKIQFLALFLGGIFFMLLGQMPTYISICICTFLLSMCNESFRPANAAAIAYYSSPQTMTQSFSLIRLAINLGWGIGVALGGFVASINYHLLFWVDGFTSISAGIFLLLILPRVSFSEQIKGVNILKHGNTSGSALADKKFLIFLALATLFACCFFQLFTTIPVFMKEELKLNELKIGTIMAMNGIIIALIEMVLVFKLEGKRPYLFYMSISSVFMGIAFLCLNLPLSSGLLIAVFAVLVVTTSEMLGMPFMNSYYIARSNELNRGQYTGLYTMAWSSAQVIGSSGGAYLAVHTGFNGLWYITASISLLAAGGYFLLYRNEVKTI